MAAPPANVSGARRGRNLRRVSQSPNHPALRHGRLTRTVHSRRTGRRHDNEPILQIEHREALMYALSKAAELEHLIICQYLFASFSLKRDTSEGLPEEVVPTVRGWAKTLNRIAEQEMLHLALVQNLLTAVGGGPHLARPNFPVPPRSFPARIQIVLLPFGEDALRHFAFLERPEGEPLEDVEAFTAAIGRAQPLPDVEEDEIGPIVADFETISHLYRSIEDGLSALAEKLGERNLFIGPPRAQATGEHFRFPELVAVTDLASARAAIETIVEQGEGARGEWKQSHFGRLLGILDEFIVARDQHPDVVFTRPVQMAHVRPVESGVSVALMSERFTVRAMDLLNAVYEVALQVLARYFNHTEESDAQLSVLADVAFFLMENAIAPIGAMVTQLPIGPDYPGKTAGPAFELFYDADWLLPHRDAAWRIIGERLNELAEFAVSCRNECPIGHIQTLTTVAQKLRSLADSVNAAAA
jgi:hypothetical protein